MVTALGGSAAAAATVSHASIEIPAASLVGLIGFDAWNKGSGASEIGASRARSAGEATHV